MTGTYAARMKWHSYASNGYAVFNSFSNQLQDALSFAPGLIRGMFGCSSRALL